MEDGTWVTAAGDRTRRSWRSAYRHSRFVRVLRIALPVVSVAIVAAMLASLRGLPDQIGNLSLGEVGISGSTLTMENPSLTGYGSGGSAYDVTAIRALQELDDPDIVHLETISGRLQQSDGGWATLNAVGGIYNSRTEKLQLDDDIQIVVHDGKRAFLEKADVDLKAESVVSDKPVRLEMPSARVRAETMEVFSGGDEVHLRGNVVVDIRLDGGTLEEEDDVQ